MEDTSYPWGALVSETNTWNTSICTPAGFTAPVSEGSPGDSCIVNVSAGSTYYVVVRTQDDVRDASIHSNPDKVATVTITFTPKSA